MISHAYRTVFLHIPRTGGTSIKSAFGFVEYEGDTITKESAGFGEVYKTARQIQKIFPQVYKHYYKWTIVRNPWEREVSIFNSNPVESDQKSVQQQFIDSVKAKINNKNQIKSQTSFLMIDGDVHVDHIVRYESIDSQWPIICEKINKPCEPLPRLLKGTNPQFSKHEIYTQESVDLVSELCKEDIEFLNYDCPY